MTTSAQAAANRRRGKTAEQRFESWVQHDPQTACWVWVGALTHNGYGRFYVAGKTVRAHRWSFEHYKGLIPTGMTVDHLCRVKVCVNPDHLEAVTPRENNRRGVTIDYRNSLKTTCMWGHPLEGDNLRVTARGQRQCHECRLEASRRFRLRQRGAA